MAINEASDTRKRGSRKRAQHSDEGAKPVVKRERVKAEKPAGSASDTKPGPKPRAARKPRAPAAKKSCAAGSSSGSSNKLASTADNPGHAASRGQLSTLTVDDYKVSFTKAKTLTDYFANGRSSAGGGGGGFQSARSLVSESGSSKLAQKTQKAEQQEQNASADGSSSSTIRLDATQSQISKMDINKPLLIVAGAGSGKTSTLCARVLEIIKQGVPPASILVITFTNKAACELTERIQKYMELSGLRASEGGLETRAGEEHLRSVSRQKSLPYSSTFHSWCYQLILRNYRSLGLSKCPMVATTDGECKLVLDLAINQIENCRKLVQCEKMLDIPPPPASGDESWAYQSLYIHDSDTRWKVVVDLTKEKTGFSVDGVDVVDTEPKGRGRKSKHAENAAAVQTSLATHAAIYSHLYAKFGRKMGLVSLSGNEINFTDTFQGKNMELAMLNFIHSAKSRGNKPEVYPQIERTVLEAYNSMLRKFSLMDFDDLLDFASKILESPEALDRVRSQFPYLLVDEFQDLNNLQMRIVLQLQKDVGKVTAVGDERQSIYAFRGASCENNFKTFLENFVDAEVGKTAGSMESLTRNYRSHQSIVDLGNIVAKETTEGNALLQRLRVPLTAQPTAPIVPITVWSSDDSMDEAKTIAKRIKDMIDAGDCKKSDIAVLSRCLQFGAYRPTGAIEAELLRHGIPYVVRGGASALRTKRIQLFLALLKLLVNAEDDIAMRLCLDELVYGLGEAAIRKIEDSGPQSLFIKVKHATRSAGLVQKRARDGLMAFIDDIEKWQMQLGLAHLRDIVRDVYKTYVAEVTVDDGSSHRFSHSYVSTNGEGDEEKQPEDKVWNLVSAMLDSFTSSPIALPPRDDDSSFDAENTIDPSGPCTVSLLYAFATHVSMLSGSSEDKGELTLPKDAKKDGNDNVQDAVIITTVHQAKGLEWEHVFIPHFNEGLFPLGFREAPKAETAKINGNKAVSAHKNHHYREEGRLAYVAITRAKRGLCISVLGRYPLRWMEKFMGRIEPSRYLPQVMCPPERKVSYGYDGYNDYESGYY
ncbi:hypothetical protein GGI12_003513 [Dipsacomyces acuminosporus]|nr:hypothetical protein GGI12_003513 [Dipsacomyces acuminosporus]